MSGLDKKGRKALEDQIDDKRFKRVEDEASAKTTVQPGSFGPPSYEDDGDEDPRVDSEAMRRRWQAFEGGGEEEEEVFDEEGLGVGEYEAPISMRSHGGSFLKEAELFPGGPLMSEIHAWKKEFEQDGHSVNMTEHVGQPFVWRTLSRLEYREVMVLPNTDPLQREEIFCEICVLWPYEYKFTKMAGGKAGIPALLSEAILKESGFEKPLPPIRL